MTIEWNRDPADGSLVSACGMWTVVESFHPHFNYKLCFYAPGGGGLVNHVESKTEAQALAERIESAIRERDQRQGTVTLSPESFDLLVDQAAQAPDWHRARWGDALELEDVRAAIEAQPSHGTPPLGSDPEDALDGAGTQRCVPGYVLDALAAWCAAFDASLPPPGTSLTIEPSCAALREACRRAGIGGS